MWNEKVSATSFCLKFNGDRCPVFPCRDSRSLAWWLPGDFKRCQLGRSWGSIQPDLRICYIYRSYRYIPWICLIVKIADGGGPWHSAGIGPAGGRKGRLTVGEYLATSVPIVPFGTTNSDDYLVVTRLNNIRAIHYIKENTSCLNAFIICLEIAYDNLIIIRKVHTNGTVIHQFVSKELVYGVSGNL